MSRTLPQKPSLQHLRKQAKQLLRSMHGGKLADAQHALAQEYGFNTWPMLKLHVEAQSLSPAEQFEAAVCGSHPERVRELLQKHPELRQSIDSPLHGHDFGEHALFAAVQRTDRVTVDILLGAGADIHKRTEWWAGGFGILDDCDPGLVEFLIERGAILDAHSAARLGIMPKLRDLMAADLDLVHARGGDGQTPLHFASTVEVAHFLLDNGADIDARDVDHESTPAQYMLRVEQKRRYPKDRQGVARYLVSLGSYTDILMAAALGDLDLVRQHVENNPASIGMRVSEEWFPKHDPRSGGTIYTWTLGAGSTAHSVARDFGHEHVFQWLLEHTPSDLKFALACELGDETAFREFLSENPRAIAMLSETEQQKLPHTARNNNTNAVRLMLEAGWPVDTPGEMGATALHWAGFNGNAEMTREILRFHPTLELKSREYAGPAVAWAVFGSGNSWHSEDGDYVETIRLLLEAGAVVPPNAEDLEPSEAVLELLP